LADFALSPRKEGGRDPRCRKCVNEQAKLSIRLNRSLPRYVELALEWDDNHLATEIEWQQIKLTVLLNEQKARKKQ